MGTIKVLDRIDRPDARVVRTQSVIKVGPAVVPVGVNKPRKMFCLI